MTHPALRRLTIILLALMLAACASHGGRLQHAGEVALFDLTITTDLDWARYRAPRQELWTIDGPLLNQLRIISGIKPGEHVFLRGKQRKSRPDGPWFRPSMRPDEVRDLVRDALRLEGWSQVSAHSLRPAQMGPHAGLRFGLDLISASGLRYQGQAIAAERDGKLTLLLWLAPAEHYYPRDVEAVERLFDTLQTLP